MMARVQQQGGQAANIGIGADFHGIQKGQEPRERILPAHTGIYDFDERALGFAVQLLSHLVLELQPHP